MDTKTQPQRESAPVSQLDDTQTPEKIKPDGTKEMLAELHRIEQQNKTNTNIQDPPHDAYFPGSSMKK